MKTPSQQPTRAGCGRPAFRLRPVALSCTALLLAASDMALAQQQAEQQVTVTGIRRGIESAISVKKNADGIVEAVSAEDIGKLPDSSIAESIARLPGISAQRAAGRAQVISVRGLSPDFATTLLNGREMVSTGDNRSVEFDQYPSELLSGVTVYKTPDAILRAQLAAWDKVTAKKAEENPMFKKVLESMRAFAQRSGRWQNDTTIDYRMAWNHYFAPKKKG